MKKDWYPLFMVHFNNRGKLKLTVDEFANSVFNFDDDELNCILLSAIEKSLEYIFEIQAGKSNE